MTLLLGILAALVIAFVAHGAWRQNQLDRKWRAERERIERHNERMAAHNGRPDGDVVAITPTTRPRGPAGTDPDPPLTPEQMQGRIGY
jgi:hypothetical protein